MPQYTNIERSLNKLPADVRAVFNESGDIDWEEVYARSYHNEFNPYPKETKTWLPIRIIRHVEERDTSCPLDLHSRTDTEFFIATQAKIFQLPRLDKSSFALYDLIWTTDGDSGGIEPSDYGYVLCLTDNICEDVLDYSEETYILIVSEFPLELHNLGTTAWSLSGISTPTYFQKHFIKVSYELSIGLTFDPKTSEWDSFLHLSDIRTANREVTEYLNRDDTQESSVDNYVSKDHTSETSPKCNYPTLQTVFSSDGYSGIAIVDSNTANLAKLIANKLESHQVTYNRDPASDNAKDKE